MTHHNVVHENTECTIVLFKIPNLLLSINKLQWSHHTGNWIRNWIVIYWTASQSRMASSVFSLINNTFKKSKYNNSYTIIKSTNIFISSIPFLMIQRLSTVPTKLFYFLSLWLSLFLYCGLLSIAQRFKMILQTYQSVMKVAVWNKKLYIYKYKTCHNLNPKTSSRAMGEQK